MTPEAFGASCEVVRAHAGAKGIVAGVNLGLIGDIDAKDRDEFLIRRFGPGSGGVRDAFLAGRPAEVIDRVREYEAGRGRLGQHRGAGADRDGGPRAFAGDVLPHFGDQRASRALGALDRFRRRRLAQEVPHDVPDLGRGQPSGSR